MTGTVLDSRTTQKQGVKAESGIKSGPALRTWGQVKSRSQERIPGKRPSGEKQTHQSEHLKTLKQRQSYPRKKPF